MTAALPPLPAPILTALADKGFESLTPVQEAVLDPGLQGRDLLVSAQTGSGKTLAFGLAMAEGLIEADGALPPPSTPQALIIAPTRELALQVGRELAWLYAPAGAVIAHCVGGMDPRAERRVLERGAHIVVGTPGRLRDHLERRALDTSTLATVVLDEADEMLDLGFREDLEFLLAALPVPRRTLMFSATLSSEIERLALTYMSEPARVATEARRAAHADIAYQALVVEAAEAETAIVNVLRFHEARNALVFCKTRAAVNHLTARFHNRGFAVVPLSGELAQEERTRALQALRDGRARVCVATDVAARGIDLPGLDLVIHADLPGSTETLLHRSGRTGRAGRKGVSVLIVPLSARKKVARMLAQAAVSAEWSAAPTAAEVTARDTERLLTDPALTGPETADEAGLVTLLAERFTARELAAAVARQYFAARSAPEDVSAVDAQAPATRDGERGEGFVKQDRGAFQPGPWFRLSVGAEDGAEARWLLPLLCRAGDITRNEIGAIRVQEDHTLVQISQDGAAKFLATLGETMALDDKIRIEETDEPDLTKLKFVKMGPKGRDDRGPRAPRRDEGERPARNPRPPRAFDAERPARAPWKGEDRPARPAWKSDARPPRPARGDDDRPARPRPFGGERPARHDDDRPARAPYRAADRPADRLADRPGQAEGETRAPRPFRAEGDRPARGPRPEGAGFKPARPKRDHTDDAPRKPRPARAPEPQPPVRPRIDAEAARNPSARLAPPKGAKPARKGPGGKPGAKPFGKPRPGGDQPPRRPGGKGPGRPRG